MKTICFYFQIHQPFRLKRYRFFDIGSDHYYYDDFNNEEIIKDIARKSYIPATRTLMEMINNSDGKFKVAFSLSGVVMEQLEIYVPEFIESLKELAATGSVEFLSETYSHSLSSLKDSEEFERQVKMHSDKIFSLFGQRPAVFRNTELIYSDDLSDVISELGFKGVITEGAKHILGWKSPNYVYESASNPNLKLLLKNSKLSDDICFNFSKYDWSEYPLTADKFINWVASTPEGENVINLFMNYETLGSMQPEGTGIFEFMKALPRFAEQNNISFSTPSQIIDNYPSAGVFSVLHPISWADEERDTSAWLGNVLQKEAFERLYSVGERVRLCSDRRLLQDWDYLQSSDHFYYMSTKRKSDGAMHKLFSPYDSPYEAFTNYMNVLSDFIMRVQQQYPLTIENEELNALLTTIKNQGTEIHKLEDKLLKAKAQNEKTKKLLEEKEGKTKTKKSSEKESKSKTVKE
ncbi:MAG: glycoside hydrolase family 57 protein [Bacteroidales bacterium]|nr:glycoside hydrolase family 57 protein [Bacteroidales bacterium]